MPYDAETYARLAQQLLNTDTFPYNTEEIVEFSQEVVAADYAGLTLIHADGRLETTCASADLVCDLDQWQYEQDEGPCRDAAWTQHTLICEDLTVESRWPNWTPRAITSGIRSILAAELTARGRRWGALNLYSTRPRHYPDDDIGLTSLFADQAAVALATADHESNLTVALDTRTLIGRAQGILMERFGLSAEQAFAVLKRYSQDRNVKLRIVAQHLVATRQLPNRTPE